MSTIAVGEPHAPLEEDFAIEVDRGQLAHHDPVEAHLAVGCSRSRCRSTTTRRGRIVGSARDLARFVGATIVTKNQIIAALAILDKPAVTWESESLDKLHRNLRDMLEIDERFKALEYKLRTIQETLELFLDLQQTRRSMMLELTIVLLIVFEIGLTLYEKLR